MPGGVWKALSEAYVFFKGLQREKEILFWVVIFPILFYGLMVAIFGSPDPPEVSVAVVNEDGGPLARALLEAMNLSGLFEVKVYSGPEEAKSAMDSGTADAILIIPDGFSENLTGGGRGMILVEYRGGEWGNFTYGTIAGFLSAFEDAVRARAAESFLSVIPPPFRGFAEPYVEALVDPVEVKASPEAPEILSTPGGLRALYAFNVVGIQALFVGLFTGVQAITEKRRTGALRIILSSPISSWQVLAADTLGAIAAVAASAAVVLPLSIALGADYSAIDLLRGLTAAALITAGVIFTTGLGLILAPLARTPSGAAAIANLIGFTVMFAGGLAVPAFVLPDTLKAFAQAWPLTALVYQARALVTGEAGFHETLAAAAPHAAATIAVYTIGLLVYRRMLERAVEA